MAAGKTEHLARIGWTQTSALMATVMNLFAERPIPFDAFDPYSERNRKPTKQQRLTGEAFAKHIIEKRKAITNG